jgi:TRAP-type C4-dicarboxylate transport system permease small subunit
MDPQHEGGGAPAALRWLAKAEVALVSAILLTSFLITLDTIIERNIGRSTGDWSLKLPELMLVWMTFLGMGALVTEHGHVAADMVLRRFSPRWQRICETISCAVTSLILVLILAGAVSIVRQQVDIGATDDELGNIPTAYILSIMPVGIALTVLHLLAEIYVIWRRPDMRAPPEFESPRE